MLDKIELKDSLIRKKEKEDFFYELNYLLNFRATYIYKKIDFEKYNLDNESFNKFSFYC